MLEIRNLTKIYRSKTGEEVKALDNVSVSFPDRGMVFILGKSGSGKSTLLNVMGGLDSYDNGEFIIKGKSSNDFGGSDFDAYRNTFIGFIFQEYNVLDDFTVGANIGLALELQGKKATDEAVNGILSQVDLLNYAKRKPNELSGGQKQRVAIARALVKEPEIIMADEPTGALDSNTGKQIFDTLKELSKEKLVLIVSHDRDFAERYADRIIELADGKIIEDVTKHEHQAERVSDGVHRINDHILRIESGYKLTAKDLEMINAYLAKNEGDVLLSGDGRVNEELRSAAGISKDGATTVFEGTSEADVVTKSYTKEDARFIRSKLPMKNAVKMGSSGLKHKKFRLFMTILLSFISFAMFGLSSSLAAYEKIEAATSSIIDSQIRSAAVTLGVRRTTTWDDGDSYTSHDGHGLNEDDIAWLKQETGLEFVPVFTGKAQNDKWSSDNGFDITEMLLNYSSNTVYNGKLSGFVDVKSIVLPAEYTVTGALPTKAGEIAITDFMYRQFKQYGFISDGVEIKPENLATPNDIIGKTFTISRIGYNHLGEGSNFKFKIVGVIDTQFNYDRYANLMPVDETTLQQQQQSGVQQDASLIDMFLTNEIKYERDYGFHALGFAMKDDIDDMSEHMSKNYYGPESEDFNRYMSGMNSGLRFLIYKPAAIEGDNPEYLTSYSSVSSSSALSKLENQIMWFTNGKTTLEENEILLPLESINSIFNSKELQIDYTAFDAAVLALINNTAAYNEGVQNQRNRLDLALECYSGTQEEFYGEPTIQTAILQMFGMPLVQNVTAQGVQALADLIRYGELRFDTVKEAVVKMLVTNFVINNEYHKLSQQESDFVQWFLNRDKNNMIQPSEWNGMTDDQRMYSIIGQGSWFYMQYANRFELSSAEVNAYAVVVWMTATNTTASDLSTYLNGLIFKLEEEMYGAGESTMKEYQTLEGMTVAGFFISDEASGSIVSKKVYDTYLAWYEAQQDKGMIGMDQPTYTEDVAEHEQGIWAFAVAPISADNHEAIRKLVEFSYADPEATDYLFEMQNAVMYTLGSFNEMIEVLSQVFVWVGLALAVFSSFLLMNFISTSISYKKREIGILRAVGARSSDVFKIFFSEAFIIALINFVLASIASIVVVFFLNDYMRDSGINITLLSFGIIQILLMFAISVVVAFLASFLPVRSIARKKPVDAIKDR